MNIAGTYYDFHKALAGFDVYVGKEKIYKYELWERHKDNSLELEAVGNREYIRYRYVKHGRHKREIRRRGTR